MVHICLLCKWRTDKVPKRSFHRFPLEEDERKKWLKIIGKEDAIIRKWTMLCCIHFEESCFRYGLICGTRALIKGSLPSLHLNPTDKIEEPEPEDNINCIFIKGEPIDTEENDLSFVPSSQPIDSVENGLSFVPSSPKECVTISDTFDTLNMVQTIIYEKENTSDDRSEQQINDVISMKDKSSIPLSYTEINYWKNELREKSKRITALNRKIRKLQVDKINLQIMVKDYKWNVKQLQKKVKFLDNRNKSQNYQKKLN